jgi:Transketolase, C-terminal subunit
MMANSETVLASASEVYVKTIIGHAMEDQDIVMLDADLMRSHNTASFFEKYPERFFNVGIAEQNMMSIAAGLALSGKKVYVSSFAAFATMRACEQVRTDICYHNADVCIVATHAGLTCSAGATHAAQEDMAIARLMPNMTVIAPGDPRQVAKIIDAVLLKRGPHYIRIGRGTEPVVYHEDYPYEIGKAITTNEGSDMTIIACGAMVYNALEAARAMKEEGVSVRVIDMHTIKPLDAEVVAKAVKETGIIVTVEDHNTLGGLGSAVAEVIADNSLNCRFKRMGIPNVFVSNGATLGLYAKYGIDSAGILKTARNMI